MAFFKSNRFFGSGRANKSIPDGLWMKCSACEEIVYRSEMEANLQVCPLCSHHHRLPARQRIEITVDPDTFIETHANVCTTDPLSFEVGSETYAKRVERIKEKTGLTEALVCGIGQVEGTRAAIGAMDSNFIMASMGSAMGEKFCRLCADAIREQVPLLIFAASGGARMQEGILALMQMAKTAGAVRKLNENAIPYVVVLTDPTSGGVFASFASLGDVILAEPKAYIGFAGARLIEGALRVKLPEGFQRAEYQYENGFIDQIIPRAELRPFLGRLLRYLTPEGRSIFLAQ